MCWMVEAVESREFDEEHVFVMASLPRLFLLVLVLYYVLYVYLHSEFVVCHQPYRQVCVRVQISRS